MEVEPDFKLAWLAQRIDWAAYFQELLGSSRAARNETYRTGVEHDRDQVARMLQDGDEVWSWRFANGCTGAEGIALLRRGQVVRAWRTGTFPILV